MVGTFAESERAIIRKRTRAGLQATRAQGRPGGGRKKLTQAQRADIVDNFPSGHKTGAEMARLYHVSEPIISRIVSEDRVGADAR
jgi:DNA invertase Pin-like site-specific DNA recombinase